MAIMRERLLMQKSPSFRGRALDLMNCCFHKAPSKFSPYEFNLRFKPARFVRKPFFKVVLNNNSAALENVFFRIIL
jgi:hypothetical protein